jgi:predicted DNA-binding transcriptional regulator YafY
MLELAWHLFTWGDKLTIVAPQILKDTLVEQIAIAARAHASDSVAGGA